MPPKQNGQGGSKEAKNEKKLREELRKEAMVKGGQAKGGLSRIMRAIGGKSG